LSIRKYIINRVDGISLDEYLPKRKNLKIIIKCSNCGLIRQSNSYDVLTKNSTLCKSCIQKKKWEDNIDFKNKIIEQRNNKEYKLNMSISIKKSEKYKRSRYKVDNAIKKYWENVRGCKFEDIEDIWYVYRRTVYKMTEKNYRKYKNVINPDNLPRGRGKYHIDHKYSVLEGFKNNIPPYIISHCNNLQMLTEFDNISKDFKCDISKERLFKEVFAHGSGN
jgi:hypothetical protein